LVFHSGREANHSPPSSAEVKEWVDLYLYSPNTSSWRDAQVGEHRDNFTFLPYGSDISSQGLLGCNAVQSCVRIPTFQMSMLPRSSG
jgi:hypothetical protein